MQKQPATSQPVRTTAAELKANQPLSASVTHDEDTAEHPTVCTVQGEGQKVGKLDSFILASKSAHEAAVAAPFTTQ